jgi:hypothetical protein
MSDYRLEDLLGEPSIHLVDDLVRNAETTVPHGFSELDSFVSSSPHPIDEDAWFGNDGDDDLGQDAIACLSDIPEGVILDLVNALSDDECSDMGSDDHYRNTLLLSQSSSGSSDFALAPSTPHGHGTEVINFTQCSEDRQYG